MRQKYYKQKQIADSDSKQFEETAKHIIPACSILAKEPYINRHNRLCAQLHFNLCKEIALRLEDEHWENHVTK